MELDLLTAISPIDGRYRGKAGALASYFSEFALIKYRVQVEIEYFITLCELPLPQLKDFDHARFDALRAIYKNEITNAKKKENAKKLKTKLKKMGVEKAPEQYSQQMYNGKWKTVIEINLTDDVPDEIELPEQKGQMYWYETWRDLRIVTKAPKEKKKLTKEELAKKEQDRKSKEVKEILKGSAARRKDFISGIISGKIPALKDENAAREKIWEALVLIGYGLYGSIARGFFLEDDEWKYSEEERKQATETFQGLSITHQMLVFLHGSMNTVGETYDYSGRYAKEKADKLLKGYEALKLFGWFFEMDEEKRVLDGTSELFAPAEEK